MSAYTPNTTVEVVGLKEALREINKIDKVTRREITKEYKNIVSPVILSAQQVNMSQLALSGFAGNWITRSGYRMFPLLDTRLSKLMVAGTSGKKPKEFNGRMQNSSVFFIRWKSPQATLLEMAAKGKLGQNMTMKSGPPGRVMWKAWEQHENEVMENMRDLVSGIMKMYTVKLGRR